MQEAAKIVTCHDDSANCSPEEIHEQAKMAEQIYEDTMHNNINTKWNLTEVLTIKLNASMFLTRIFLGVSGRSISSHFSTACI